MDEELSRVRSEASEAKTWAELAERVSESRTKAAEASETRAHALAEVAEGSFVLLSKILGQLKVSTSAAELAPSPQAKLEEYQKSTDDVGLRFSSLVVESSE